MCATESTGNGFVDTDVLVVGGGPVGLTAALELRRRGVDVTVIDRLDSPAMVAKAVGIQPRTLELWDAAGIARPALDAATTLRGQISYRNGEQTARVDMRLPDAVPYQFAALPQYETERVLAGALTGFGTHVERGVELTRLTQDTAGVTATLRDGAAEYTLRSRYLVGCDGAHSTVRRSLGLDFAGDAFPEEYMLADVEVDWDMPPGYAVRIENRTGDRLDDVLVCIPLPGYNRYRVSMLVPDELSTTPGADGVGHGLEGDRRPELRHIQAVLDRLSPRPVTASNMRWSSVFRISHRLVDRYRDGRVFVAGDAAHIHPPTGAQGMNTGVQDAINLAWKLALAVRGVAADGLLDTYHRERHPIGEEVVGRTVRAARGGGVGAGERDLSTVLAREAQLLVAYPDSPLVADDATDGDLAGGPVAGDRAPDVRGLTQDVLSAPASLHELFRHTGHTLLLWAAAGGDALDGLRRLADTIRERAGGEVRGYLIVAGDAALPEVSGNVFRDGNAGFAATYATGRVERAAYLIRPDGYVGLRTGAPAPDSILAHLGRTLTLRPQATAGP